MRVGIAAIGRPTFDVPYAEEMVANALEALGGLDHDLVIHPGLALSPEDAAAAANGLTAQDVDAAIVLLATFTDSTLVEPFRAITSGPLVLWSFPEDRTGGRLRLNSLCGLNLAAYALEGDVRGMYAAPGPDAVAHLGAVLSAPGSAQAPTGAPIRGGGTSPLAGRTVGVIGDAPTGFGPCRYDDREVADLLGMTVDRVELDDLFDDARGRDGAPIGAPPAGVEDLDDGGVGRSYALHRSLRALVDDRGWSGLATRCWPECFTDYGSAACAAQGLLADDGIPASCEADVYGSITALLLQEVLDGPAFVADLVHLDAEDDTAVMWHCGVAAPSLAAGAVGATVHSNRLQPLLHEFALKPGPVTLARLSRSPSGHRLVIGEGEMLEQPLPFGGTAGVMQMGRPVEEIVDLMVSERLDHHYGLAYGTAADELEAIAEGVGLPVVRI
ncbi:MAG: hypothetical protein HKN46_01805 [Acidimicrobiia bacterium]|nr:hypothetical protein [Acidimicrobiia bacterium]